MEEMYDYIGVKMIKAIPENREGRDGYFVLYPDGYQSWSPKEAFEKAYFKLSGDRSKTGPTITEDDIERFMFPSSAVKVSPKAATVETETRTGFLMYETSACVDPKNYDQDIAIEIGETRNRQKLWGHLGFVLQWAINGLKEDDS